ncbi:MAG: hypothetical protein QNJ65_15330 [Xenococcaceae cyanobacterium MO_234.B1]|nr:hypothetical protein [Xenococcaceae cyanobacterium MO_234.B1]
MTPEEIQKTLEGMLKIQKELQQTQINLQQTQITQSEEIKNLIEQGKEQDRRIQQLVGYSISQAGDVLDVQMALRDIYARLSKLENKEDQ